MGTRIEGKVVTQKNTIRFCDVCGKEANGYGELISLLADYATNDIGEICKSCETVINKKNSALLSWVLKLRTTWCKQFIAELKVRHTHE